MALTITEPTYPDCFVPSGNPIVFTFSTTNVNIDLVYSIDVIINGVIATRMRYPVYNRDEMNIDFSRIVNDYLTNNFINSTYWGAIPAAKLYSPSECCQLQLAVSEEYTDSIGQHIISNPVNTNPICAWIAAGEFQKVRNIESFQDNFDYDGGAIYDMYGKFFGVKKYPIDVCKNTTILQGSPNIFNNLYSITETAQRTASFFSTSQATGDSTHTMYLNCWVYDEQYQLRKVFVKQLHQGDYGIGDYQKRIAQVPTGPLSLNGVIWDSVTLLPGLTNKISIAEGDRYYFVTVCAAGNGFHNEPRPGDQTPEGFKWIGFRLIQCSPYDQYYILYKSRDGGCWQISANMKSRKSVTTNSNIKYNPWKLDALEEVSYSVRFSEVMHKDANDTIILNTDWLESQSDIDEIEDMILSPDIYLIKDSDEPTYIPVILKDSTFNIANKEQDKRVQYGFEFEVAYKNNTIR